MTEDTYRYTQYRTQTVWESLIGKTVEITWKKSGGLWARYKIERVDSDWIILHGVHEPDEVTGGMSEYIGGPIVVRMADIEMAEIIE